MAELATKSDLRALEQSLQIELRSAFERQTLQLTVRFGAMLAVAIGVLATILKPA
jgi:hypothetical protein